MVCETKIVAAEDHEALPGAQKDALLAAAGAMWPPLPAAPGPAAAPAAPPPAPGPQARGGAGGADPPEGRGVYIREFRAAEQEAARRIFYDGIMERIPNTAFRGLRQHPRAQLLYALLAGQCAGTRRGGGVGAAGRTPACRSARPPGPLGTRTGLPPALSPPTPRPRPRREADPCLPLGRARSAAAPGRGGPRRWGRSGLRAKARWARAWEPVWAGCRGCGRGGLGSPPASPPGSSRVGAGERQVAPAAEAPRPARVTIYNPPGGGGCLAGSKC